MPKTKAKSVTRPAEESDEDVPMTQTQSLTQAEKSYQSIKQVDIERKVSDLVQYLLITDQKKMPIKRQDINKHVLKENSKAFPIFIRKAEEKLRKVFGIELEEIEGKKSYILVNKIETDVDEAHLEWSQEDNAKTGLLVVVLSLIFMNDNMMGDTKLFHALTKLGVDIEQPHEVFGDVKKLLTQEFVRQGYVEFVRQELSEPPAYDFKWGPRAKLETSKRNILDFVCQVYGDIEPHSWTSQWQDVVRTEGDPGLPGDGQNGPNTS